jgi:hypothetical protein
VVARLDHQPIYGVSPDVFDRRGAKTCPADGLNRSSSCRFARAQRIDVFERTRSSSSRTRKEGLALTATREIRLSSGMKMARLRPESAGPCLDAPKVLPGRRVYTFAARCPSGVVTVRIITGARSQTQVGRVKPSLFPVIDDRTFNGRPHGQRHAGQGSPSDLLRGDLPPPGGANASRSPRVFEHQPSCAASDTEKAKVRPPLADCLQSLTGEFKYSRCKATNFPCNLDRN